ncbi:HD-GYP domain-containing protein [Tepidibacter thalassicus]|uniref:HDOD domain-containing protein n=1 Tax=Tepidibacter thalassicus DSM 15285 TaxID=1123350 RepID=A0A1M5RJN4_9FIRM|nr:HD domain-containing phosphohydrolase [Tepidibacter thalassicus]SHH26592.1 HDOD domain-containing protein [Tepidibacter thalassicus DSM 15285]
MVMILRKKEQIIEHGYRVASLAKKLAQKIGLSEKEIDYIYLVGLNHDMGKKYLDFKILNKKEMITQKEDVYKKMYVLLSTSIAIEKKMPLYVIKGIMHHCENFDGTGYPYNLKGYKIPIQSRIIRIIDAYDTLMTDNCLNKNFDIQKIIEIMDEEVNNFDINIYLKFKEMLEVDSRNLKKLKVINE